MKKVTAIAYVFLDIGGVLLTNGWDHHAPLRGAPSSPPWWEPKEHAPHSSRENLRELRTWAEEISPQERHSQRDKKETKT